MAQFDGMHLCINTCIVKRKLEFPRKKIEPQCVCMIVSLKFTLFHAILAQQNDHNAGNKVLTWMMYNNVRG
jgi:hypothetical protein